MTYIAKTRNGVATADDIRVTYGEVTRVKSRNDMFNVIERVGWDRSKLIINILTPLTGKGFEHGSDRLRVDKTAASLKTKLRRLREQEAAEIAEIDDQIAVLKEQIGALRMQRQACVQAAWSKGNVVRLNELEIRE